MSPVRNAKISSGVRAYLEDVYGQIMWLAKQPDVTPSMARAWYTHVIAGKVKRHIRHFSGMVSQTAARSPGGTLRLEHHRQCRAYSAMILSSKPVKRRAWLGMICGSKLPSRSRGTSMRTGPSSVMTVLPLVPLRWLTCLAGFASSGE